MSESTDDIAASTAAAGEAARAAVGRFAEDMRGVADSLMESQKERIVQMAQGVASALRRSADAFADEGSEFFARGAGRAADQVDRLAGTMHGQSWRESIADIEAAARRRPELFFAAAVAAGFILGRLVNSGTAAETMER